MSDKEEKLLEFLDDLKSEFINEHEIVLKLDFKQLQL